jgi:tetratricopeptide (TPR) repeat protein
MPHQILWAIPASALYIGRHSGMPAVRLVVRGLDALKAGHLDDAERLARDALETARKGRHSLGEGMAALLLSNLYWGLGRTQPALDMARQAREVFRRQPGPDQRHNEAVSALNLGLVRHLMEDYTGALNEYHDARQLLDNASQYWITQKETEQADLCEQLQQWAEHLIERLTDSPSRERALTLFLPVHFADGAKASLWGEYARDASLILDGKTLRILPLRDWLVLTADCCVFPVPDPQMHQLIQQQVGEDGDYILAQPGDPLPDDPFYISVDSQGITEFIRQQDGTVMATIQLVRIIGGPAPTRYRPVALAV